MAKIVKNNISYTAIPSSASMLPYDNYDSGLEATNVKDAIDELAAGGTSSTLAGLADVDITSPSSGQVLQYNGEDWVNANGGGGSATSLDDLSDVDISSASLGQVLKYNGSDWVNANESGGASALTDLSDVSVSSASNGQVLTYNNGDWVNSDIPTQSIDLDDISDVDISSPSNGQVLKYNNGDWVNANESGGASSLNELSDVTITSASSGQVLKYDGTKWANAAESGGTTVVANPSGSSSADLTKLQVDNTIYAIPSGGSDVSVTQIQSTGTKIATITVDSVGTDLYAPNGGGSGGHTIVNEDGTSLTQRTNLQFNGAYLEDNSTDDTTEVNVVRSMTRAEFNLLSADEKVGIINITDESSSLSLDDLANINLTSLADGQILKYDSTNQEWVNANESGGSSSLSGLTDVNITSVSDGQVLKYDSSSSKWVNGTGGGGVSDYEDLTNKPQVNGITLSGDKDSEDLGIVWEGTQLQYDAIVTKDPNTTYYITDADDGGDSFQPVIYSEIEREIGVWVDGKPLYEISLSFDTTSNSTYDVDTSTLLIESLVSYDFSATGNTYYYSSSDYIRGYFTDATNSTFRVVSGSDYPRCAGYVTFRYTKTSDIAGSGTWTPQGVPAVHYSTEEHIVGTWIDGKTLYARTLVLRENGLDKYPFTGSMSSGGFYAVGLTGIDKIWLDGLYAKRGATGDTDYTDIDNNSSEVVTVFKHSDGSFYIKNTHSPTAIILTIRYTKSS